MVDSNGACVSFAKRTESCIGFQVAGNGKHHGQFEWQVQYLLHTIDIYRDDYSCSATAATATATATTPCVLNDFFTNRYQLRMNAAAVSFIARPQWYCIVFNTIVFNEYPSAQNELQVHEKLFIFLLPPAAISSSSFGSICVKWKNISLADLGMFYLHAKKYSPSSISYTEHCDHALCRILSLFV